MSPSASTGISLIAGLGNPGRQRTLHRHNVGYWFIAMLMRAHVVSLAPYDRFSGSLGTMHLCGMQLLLFQADRVYINQSGHALHAVSHAYRIPEENILVAHDEIDFALAKVRLKQGGGHGGHNGVRDVIAHLGSGFWRLRIGVGHPGRKDLVDRHVLSNASNTEQRTIEAALQPLVRLLPALCAGNFAAVMNTLHA